MLQNYYYYCCRYGLENLYPDFNILVIMTENSQKMLADSVQYCFTFAQNEN
jgi:hypothetical protein